MMSVLAPKHQLHSQLTHSHMTTMQKWVCSVVLVCTFINKQAKPIYGHFTLMAVVGNLYCLFHSPDTDVPGEVLLHVKQEAETSPVCSQFTVKKEQPSAQLYHLLPSSSETCTGYEATSLSKTQDRLKPPKVNVAPDGDGTHTKHFVCPSFAGCSSRTSFRSVFISIPAVLHDELSEML